MNVLMNAQLAIPFILLAINLFYSSDSSFDQYVSGFPFWPGISFFALVRFIFFNGLQKISNIRR